MVLANLIGNDIILCRITSQFVKDNYAIVLNDFDFIRGSLNKPSNVRPNRLFTAEKSIVLRKIGTVKPEVFDKVTDKLFEIIKY
jgi:mRNA interferase MazF